MLATYETEYFLLNENTKNNGNSTKSASRLKRVLPAVCFFCNYF